jgi:peptide/nickel transport system substrate-binding protein
MASRKPKLFRTLSVGLGVLLCAAVLVAPAWGDKKDNTLNIALEKEVENLDWYFNTAREGIVLSRHVYDHLIYRDPETFEYKPLLATSWKWISNTLLEMELRKGVKFHNGAKFSADDVVYMLNWVSNPENKVKQQNYVDWIKECKKINDYKIQIVLHKPFPPALEFLSCADPIYPKDYYAKVGPKGFGVKPIGTGPYKVTEVEPGKKIVLEANQDYFAGSPKGKPSIKKIVWRTIPEVNTKIAELITGALDWAWYIPPDQAKKLAQVPHLKVVPAETMRIGFLMMDAAGRSKDVFKENPFLKRKVRQAVNYAINREAIVKNLVGGQSRLVCSACYPSQLGCTQDVTKYEYNPQKAKKLLAEAGYPNGFETTLNGYRDRPYAEAIVGDLAKVGIKANLSYHKYAALREKIRAGKTQFDFYTWGSYSINDVTAILGYYFEFSGEDMSRDPKVKELLVAGDSEMDVAKRKEYYKKALQVIAEEAYWAPLFTWVNNNCFNKDLDFTPYPDAVPRFFLAKWK